MANNAGIGTAVIYGCINPSFFHNTRILELSDVQFQIVVYAMLGIDYCASKRTGIYHISTAAFPRNLPIEEIQNQLGRTDIEISLRNRNFVAPVSRDEKEHFRGTLNKYFSDVIEYDPYSDMVFAKLAFAYCGLTYLNTSTKIIEAIHTEFKQTRYVVPERWWGEFMSKNSKRINEAWSDLNTPKTRTKKKEEKKEEDEEEEYIHKNILSLRKTFDYLFELEKQYKMSERKLSPEKLQKMKEFLEDGFNDAQVDFFKKS